MKLSTATAVMDRVDLETITVIDREYWLYVDRRGDEIVVGRSPFLHDDDEWLIEALGIVGDAELVSYAVVPDPMMMGGHAEVSVFKAAA